MVAVSQDCHEPERYEHCTHCVGPYTVRIFRYKVVPPHVEYFESSYRGELKAQGFRVIGHTEAVSSYAQAVALWDSQQQ